MQKKNVGQALIAAMLTVLVGVPCVQANESIELNKVSVTATRVERELMDVPMSVSVVTEDDIKNSSATTVAQLLQDIPGVELSAGGGPGLERISIRGENSFRTLVLIDGQKISEQKSMSGAPILIDPSRIERIEVIKGPASVLYGSDAIGGVVNIITKKSTDKAVAGNLSLGYNGATRGFTQSADIYGHLNGWNYSVAASNAKHNDSNGYVNEVNGTSYDQQDVRATLSYDFNDKFTAGFAAEHYTSTIDVPFILDGANAPNDQYGYANMPTWERTKYSAFAELKDATDYLSRVRADVWYQTSTKEFENYMDMGLYSYGSSTGWEMTNTADNDLDTIGLSLQTDWLIGDNHLLIAGYEFNQDKLDAVTGLHFVMPPMSDYIRTTYTEGTQTTNAAYLAMESSLPADFTLSYGVRYTVVQNDMDNHHIVRTGTNPSVTDGETGSDTVSKPVFNIGAVWTGIDDLALRASWAQGFRAPLLQEKYLTSTMGSTSTLYGNPDLDPETSNNFELGARYVKDGLSLDVAAFYSVAEDYISTETTTIDGKSAYVYQNVDSAKTYGVEAAVSYALDYGFRPYASVTMMRRQYDSDTRTTYDTFTPQWSGRLGLAYANALCEEVDMNADLYVRAESGSRGYIDNELTKYSGYATLNLGFGFNFGEDKAWSVQAEILNILDQKYAYHGGSYYEPGINGNLKLTYSF
ncbi:MAG: TonB-dependent receptor [Pseudomonadota bacterium]